MNDYIVTVDNYLKEALLSNITLRLDDNNYKEGTFISFTHNFFNLNIIIKNKRKIKNDILKIPIPFDIYKKGNVIYFDYKIKSFTKNNKLIETLIQDLKKPCISKYYDTILTIEVN